jgi:CHASE2 domain-containing sensor protein
MKVWYLLVALNLVTLFSKAQPEKELILLTVKNDRLELAKAIKFLNASGPKLVCVNFDLTDCDNVKQVSSNHYSNDTTAVITPSESEKKLWRELTVAGSLLLLPSELRRLGRNEFDALIGCDLLYPDGVATGFINLINSDKVLNQVEKFQISNTFRKEEAKYHFAVKIASQLNENATHSFIKSHPNILPINFARARKFKTYSMEQLYRNKDSGKDLKNKVVIVGVDRPAEYRKVSKKKKMTTSEIFANIACQLIE